MSVKLNSISPDKPLSGDALSALTDYAKNELGITLSIAITQEQVDALNQKLNQLIG